MIDAYADPGTPDLRAGRRYLWWLVRCQPGRSVAGAVFASVWMAMVALMPYAIARAVDRGIEPGDMGALALWTGVLVLVGGCTAWLSIMRHRTMTRVRMDANFRTVKVVVGQTVRLGRRCGGGSAPARWSPSAWATCRRSARPSRWSGRASARWWPARSSPVCC